MCTVQNGRTAVRGRDPRPDRGSGNTSPWQWPSSRDLLQPTSLTFQSKLISLFQAHLYLFPPFYFVYKIIWYFTVCFLSHAPKGSELIPQGRECWWEKQRQTREGTGGRGELSPRSVHRFLPWSFSGVLILGMSPPWGPDVGGTQFLFSPELWRM